MVIIGLAPNLAGIIVRQESSSESHCIYYLMLKVRGNCFPGEEFESHILLWFKRRLSESM